MSDTGHPDWVAPMMADPTLRPASYWVRAPGRVNLIGEHTDYTEGFVLPAAIDREVRGFVSPLSDQMVRVVSRAMDEEDSFRLGEEGPPGSGRWTDYVRGVTVALREAGIELEEGFALTLESTLPVAAGLSSSAALEAAVALAALAVNGVEADPRKLAPICRRAENEYVGVGCGLMDQMIVLGGRAGHAMMLDCRSLETTFVPIPDDLAIVVCDTRADRSLAESAYNQRLEECGRGLEILRRRDPATESLRDASPALLEECRAELGSVLHRRCRHVVTENFRVGALIDALNVDDRPAIGALMAQSHASLRDNYEVSSGKLDAMVGAASGCPGFVGGRLTGAGFGGCTVNLVEKPLVDEFASEILARYQQETGRTGNTYACAAAGGAASGEIV
ncbi:MAG: galactokinase [Chloroflexota bacterium]|jgi:galactokinase|nr:galactokinase [Chloroflexota bacterium]